MIAIFPELATCAAGGDVERLAVLARRYFGAGDGRAPRLDVHGLLEDAGLKVRRIAFDPVGALVGRDEGGAFTVAIVVSDRLDPDQERFLLAHALGHYLFDVQPPLSRGEWQASGFREAQCPLRRYVQGMHTGTGGAFDPEDRADRFAGALLMPLGMVRRAMERLGDVDAAAKVFGVSAPCLRRRLLDIEWAVAPAPANFLDAEQQLDPRARRTPPAQEDIAPPTAKDAASQGGLDGMPRSFAASTYAQAERLARHPETKGTKAPPKARPDKVEPEAAREKAVRTDAPSASPEPARAPGDAPAEGGAPAAAPLGMERLRQIARQLDRAGPGATKKAPSARGKERPRSR
jgi:hypothetical protein